MTNEIATCPIFDPVIPILMVPLGIILAVFSRYSLAMMGQERWLHMPVILLGVWAGFHVDGWYVVDIPSAAAA